VPEFVLFGFVFLLILGAYWALVVYPKQRDFQKRQRYVSTLNVGDEVVTYGGIIGKIVKVEADKGIAHVQIADGVAVRLITAALMQAYDPEAIAQNAQTGIEGKMPAPND
jgi:preprotein translocase subunit YajC